MPGTVAIPVILVSAVDAPQDLEAYGTLGMPRCLTKPVLPGALLAAIRQMGLVVSLVSAPHARPAMA